MIDDTNSEGGAAKAQGLRLAALAIGSVEMIVFTLLAHLRLYEAGPPDVGADPSDLLPLLPIMAMTLPGLLLACRNAAPVAALALVLLAVPTAALLW